MSIPGVCLLAVTLAASASGRYASPPPRHARLSVEEAEILLYLVPVAHVLRARGKDVVWELQRARGLEGADFYTFWVREAKQNPYGSSTVGYFSVNKRTGDVWNLIPEPRLVTSAELRGVQRIIREAHSITGATIRKYGGLRPPS